MTAKYTLLTGLVALGLTAASAHASSIAAIDPANSSTGDLILGFYSAAAGADVTFDLGQVSLFSTATDNPNNVGTLVGGTTYTVSAFTVADVTAVSGLGDNTTTKWSVMGGSTNLSYGNDPIWTTAPIGTTVRQSNNQAGAASSIDGVATETANSFNTAGGNPVSAQLTDHAFRVQAAGSYTGQYAFSPALTVGASGTTSLALWELDGTSSGTPVGINLGTFALNAGTNVLTFTPIPEPSTYAAILGALTVGFVMIRRRGHSAIFGAAA